MAVKFRKATLGASAVPGEISIWIFDNNWDDWFKFETVFSLVLFDHLGNKYDIGQTKIARQGLTPKDRRPEIPSEFDALAPEFFSLGQDESFYETLNQVGHGVATQVLAGLRDCASDLDIFSKYLEEEAMQESLLRYVSAETVRGRFNRLARGDSTLTPFDFSYKVSAKDDFIFFDFKVVPDSIPPSNVHALIGRNGVGKTSFLKGLRDVFFSEGADSSERLNFRSSDENSSEFVGLVNVAFSAFDDFGAISGDVRGGKKYAYVGLKGGADTGGRPKSLDELAVDWVKAVREIVGSSRERLFEEALKMLESDPLFEDLDISSLILASGSSSDEKFATFFKLLSSGHKIVLLTITRLVEVVEERTLVLLDEPEAHLHPPLLSAFTRALSSLLGSRNAVAIVATHSPVILQEVPSDCVWIIERSGDEVRSQRPGIETFGENVGILTSEVFTLEVTSSGYHRLIRDILNRSPGLTYKELLQKFDGKVGSEGRALMQALRHGVRS